MKTNNIKNEVLVFIRHKEKILLIHKKRGFGAGKINVPGGKVQARETPEKAAIREVKEEVGLEIKNLQKKGILLFINNDSETIITHIFVTDNYKGEPRESDEAKPFWENTNSLPYEKMWEPDKYWAPHVLKGFNVFGEIYFKNWKYKGKSIYFSNEAISNTIDYIVSNEEFCPYFSETSIESYIHAIREEVEEVAHAKTKDELKEEIGDVLHDILSLLWKLQAEKIISIEEVIDAMLKKMRERKPHVFEKKKTNFKEAVESWLKAKKYQDEKKSKSLYEALRKETKKWLLKIKPLRFRAIKKEGKEIIENIKAYEEDTEYFLKEDKIIEAFEAVVWAWAWIEIGERYGFIQRQEI